jgi:RNA polymerase sigma-54 factor
MKLRQSATLENKNRLSLTLRNWLPILQANLSELEEELKGFSDNNPLVSVESGYEEKNSKVFSKNVLNGDEWHSSAQNLEQFTVQQNSLYDVLYEQIGAPLFPTQLSEDIAFEIVENLDENGFFEGNSETIAKKFDVSYERVEKIRERFMHLDPVGIGARNVQESFLFQLEQTDISDDVYTSAKLLIENLESIQSFTKVAHFHEAMHVIKGFSNPPALEYFEDEEIVVPDLYIFQNEDGDIEVKLNDMYYPKIQIDNSYGVDHSYVKEKIKEAKGLVDALNMRKATLYKVGLMLVEYQYDYFMGGEIKPLTLKVLADEFGHNQSTISRAISHKYIACERGVILMKEFFTTGIDVENSDGDEDNVSNAAIKEYLMELVKNENRVKPYSDMKFLQLIQDKFHVKMVRRTVAKYRLQLNIAGSSERKRLYQLRGA